ncbi:tetratricopeptide repeat protein [Sinosporangium siamense]|uniref:tetratricopeptide repeat protein n=1 Tax=Sinosporangium siamense TaxID=1367973 RepID=UPI00194DC23A|nr:tetratricopeptide repeat protein [Sinosporangium siamense]
MAGPGGSGRRVEAEAGGGAPHHLWVQGARPLPGAGLPPPLIPPLDANRRLCGPYTAGSALAAGLLPDALLMRPGLVAAHAIALHAIAPDLRHLLPRHPEPLVSRVPAPERILIHAPRRTLRLANGLAEFVLACCPRERRSLTVVNAHEADHTDLELLAVLLRRVPAERLTLVICAPPGCPAPLAAALARHAVPTGGCDGPDEPRLTADDHRARADHLAATGAAGPRLGAIPHHRLKGPDPALALDALAHAITWCLRSGFHHAVAELGARALPLADPAADEELWWRILHSTANALAALDREEEAEALLGPAMHAADPGRRASAAYCTAMLKTRHHDPARRDLAGALTWIDRAVTISDRLPSPAERAFRLGFNMNGKALVQMRLGHLDDAARLVNEAISLAEELPRGRHPVHRLVLRANRAQLAHRLGHPEQALTDYDAAVEADPHYPDYYIDRGNLHFAEGRLTAAVADYEAAMRLEAPFPEAYYNRAEVRFAQGDLHGALADLTYVLDLDPGFTEAYANRAGLLAALGDHRAARAAAREGLTRTPGDPYLLCALGQAEMEDKRRPEARAAFDLALGHDPTLVAAWAARGMLNHEEGDHEAAVADLTQALSFGEDPVLLFNRALALHAAARPDEATRDLRHALTLAPDDEEILQELAKRASARPDLASEA